MSIQKHSGKMAVLDGYALVNEIERSKQMKFDILSKHRSKLMAIAMIWVVLYHATLKIENKAFRFLQINGFGGVDIFLFLFGLGMVYSLSKNNDLKTFYLNRAKRILPFVVPVLVLCTFLYGYGIRQSVLFITLLDFWANGNTVLWYFSALFVFVIIAPAMVSLLDDRRAFVVVSIISSALAFLFYMHQPQMLFASRLPVFFTGIYFGKLSLQRKKLCRFYWFLAAAITVLGTGLLYYFYHYYGDFMWSLGLYWYPFLLISPGLCILLSGIFELLETKWKMYSVGKFFSWVGKFTMEVYLFHELIIKQVDWFIYYSWDPRGYFRNLISFLIAFVIAWVYHHLIQWCLSIYERKKPQNHKVGK